MSKVKKLCNLPEEILELVLLHLPGYEIHDLTLVSPVINDVISNSVLLMKNFVIYWDNIEEPKLAVQSKRKYVEINVDNATGANSMLLNFIESHSLTLSTLTFYECKFERYEFVRMMSLVAGTLKSLNMCAVEINSTSSPLQSSKIVMPNLVEAELMYNPGDGFASFFQIVEAKNLVQLNYEDDHEFSSDEAAHFIKFLGALEKLDSLNLSAFAAKALLEDPVTHTTMKFKANRVYMWLNDRHSDIRSPNSQALTSNAMKFLQSQRGSLDDLTLCQCVLSDHDVKQMMSLNVKKLVLVECEFIWNRTFEVNNKTIESIFISSQDLDLDQNEHAVCDILTGCHSASKVRFASVEISFDLSLELMYRMPQLKKLELYHCEFEPATYPTVESMKINECEVEDVIRLVRVNRQLTSLKVDIDCRDFPNFHRALAELTNTEVKYI